MTKPLILPCPLLFACILYIFPLCFFRFQQIFQVLLRFLRQFFCNLSEQTYVRLVSSCELTIPAPNAPRWNRNCLPSPVSSNQKQSILVNADDYLMRATW